MSCLHPQIPPVHTQVLTTIGQVFVSLSLVFLLATIITFVIHKYVSKCFVPKAFRYMYFQLHRIIYAIIYLLTFLMHRSLWSMRSYIHVMLCANMFVAQLVFIVGADKTENKVLKNRLRRRGSIICCLSPP